jgi:hypothetical protein
MPSAQRGRCANASAWMGMNRRTALRKIDSARILLVESRLSLPYPVGAPLMGNPNNDAIASDNITLDGVDYEISVRQRSDGFHAAWNCGECRAAGGSIVETAVHQALDRARANVVAHHTLMHRPTN